MSLCNKPYKGMLLGKVSKPLVLVGQQEILPMGTHLPSTPLCFAAVVVSSRRDVT